MHWLQCKTVVLYRGKLLLREKTCVFPLKSPQCKARPPCQFWFWAQRLAVTEPEVPVLCAAVRLGFDTGQSDQSYANGNQMGRESPVDYRRRREACVFMYSYGDLGPLSFLPFFPLLSLSQTHGSSHVCCLHAPLINVLCDLTDFEIHCQSVNVSQNWSDLYRRLLQCLDLAPF